MFGKPQILAVTLGVALATLALLAYYSGLLGTTELKTLDLRFRLRGPMAPQAPIVVINIDQDSFDELQLPWPWPRTLHAELIRRLAQSAPKVIAFDILFTEPKPDPREDRDFGNAIKAAGNVILGAEFTEVPSDFGPRTTLSLPIPALRDNALGYGLVNLVRGPDGVVRGAVPLTRFQNQDFPAFGYRVYQAVSGAAAASTAISSDPYLIDFRGPPRSYPTVPYYRVLNGEISGDFFRAKIVLVGAFAKSLHDDFGTPFSADQTTAGVEIQANFIDTLLAGKPIVAYSGAGHLALFVLLCATAITLSLQLNPLKAFTLVFILGGIFAFSCLFIFARYRVWFPMTPSLLGVFLSYGGLTLLNYVKEQRERLRYRAQFMKYVSPDVVADILENRQGLALGGKRRHITILFSDVRGFTGISEKISPEQVVSFLSQYFAQITQIVFKHGGTVDKFIGDGMMAVFGAPQSYGDDAERAVKTGLDMIEMVRAHGAEWAQMLGKEPSIGIGINSGDAVVGSIGSELRSDYTAIGDSVNLASRLETLTKELGVPILISESTVAEIAAEMPLMALQQVKVVGRETPLLVYTAAAYADGRTTSVTAAEPSTPYVQRHK